MRTLSTAFLLILTSAGVAQTVVTPMTRMGAFARVDTQATHRCLPTTARATLAQPLAVVAESGAPAAAHARTKAALRVIDGLPALRIHEAGWLAALPAARARAAGTTDDTASVGPTPRPHAWLLRYTGTPGQRVRVHLRLRSETAGGATVLGRARVDVGRDGSWEFDRPLDGRRFLGNETVALGTSGQLDVVIETSALLTSSAKDPAAYGMTFDVSLEPVQGMVASFRPVGEACGADLFGIAWEAGNERFARLVLDNAPAQVPAFLLLGTQRINLSLPGASCRLLAAPLIMLPVRTNAVGRIITDLPPMPRTSSGAVFLQYGALTAGGVHFSKSLYFQAALASGEAHEHFEVNHILAGGQSLALGGLGAPVLSTTQPFQNLMFEGGLRAQGTKFVPLVEDFWETMSSGMTNTVSALHQSQFHNNAGSRPKHPHRQLVSVHAEPGNAYSQLRKGTQAFKNGINQHRLGQLIADREGRSYAVRCVTIVHGEEDHQRVNTVYSRDLLEWQRDYEAAIQARGQTQPVPMFHSQLSSFSSFRTAWSFIPTEQLKASVANPRKNVLVCPKYTFSYVDGVHLTSASYRQMGEYYGKVYNHVILEGGTWEPVRPLTIQRTGDTIRVRFHVPEPPLVFDTTTVTNPGHYGFEYKDSSGNPPKIAAVRILDEDTVEVRLTRAPLASARKLFGYAHTAIPGQKSGPQTGARGNLRDSDATPSRYGSKLWNWGVHFQEVIQ